jgi:hypothetical protein
MTTFSDWEVPADFALPMYNYMVYGCSPGSCFTGVLANDFFNAISLSHPMNTITAFKYLVGWIRDHMPRRAYGSRENISSWMTLSDQERRAILEFHNLIYSEQDEIMMILKNGHVREFELRDY